MNCLRCGSPLREHEPSGEWKRYFECEECWLTFSLLSEAAKKKMPVRLEQGRFRAVSR